LGKPLVTFAVFVEGADGTIIKSDPVVAAIDWIAPPFIVDLPTVFDLDPTALAAVDQGNR
jgi:hypothetical protein